MITSRNPMKDRVAIAGAATTGFVAKNTDRSAASYVAEACIKVLRECGLSAQDVDGVCGSSPNPRVVQSMLGIPEVTWYSTTGEAKTIVPNLISAIGAVHTGICETVLVYHSAYRLPWNTSTARKDPFRRGSSLGAAPGPETVEGSVGYTAWASRYIHEYGVPKEHFGLVAINDRSNAAANPAAAMRDPLTMEDYLSARMIRWPLCLYDMDIGVDGADAFVITTAERARDLALPPVLINAITIGMLDKNEEDQTPGLDRLGQQVVVRALKAKSDFWIDDCDVYFPYDGFTIITLNWFENAGFCGRGEAGAFLEQHWDKEQQRVLIDGRIPVNTHGGNLSEGATQGSGHVREAVHQLQGRADGRQIPDARRAVLTLGGFFYNSQGLTLRRD